MFLSFIQSIKTHGADLGTGNPSKKRLLVFIVPVVIAVIAILYSVISVSIIKNRAEEVLNIIATQDREAWTDILRLNRDRDIASLSAVNKKMREANAEVNGKIEIVSLLSSNKSSSKTNTKSYSSEIISVEALISDKTFIIELQYIRDKFEKRGRRLDIVKRA